MASRYDSSSESKTYIDGLCIAPAKDVYKAAKFSFQASENSHRPYKVLSNSCLIIIF